MPTINGKYTNPGWVNNSAPALDADELNAMSNAIEQNQEKRGVQIASQTASQYQFSSIRYAPENPTYQINAIAYGENKGLCACISGSVLYYNINGIDWVKRILTPAVVSGNMYDITYANGLFVSVGDNIMSAETPDGKWTAHTKPTNAGTMRAIRYISGSWVVAGDGGIFTSSDLETWSQTNAESWNDMDSDGTTLYAINSSGIKTSSNGSVWSNFSLTRGGSKISISEAGEIFIVVTQDEDISTAAVYSPSTSKWVDYSIGGTSSSIVNGTVLNSIPYLVVDVTDPDDGTVSTIIKYATSSSSIQTAKIYGYSPTKLSCICTFNNELYLGGPYANIITQIQNVTLSDPSGHGIIPAFFGDQPLADYVTSVNRYAVQQTGGGGDGQRYWIVRTYASGTREMYLIGSYNVTSGSAQQIGINVGFPSEIKGAGVDNTLIFASISPSTQDIGVKNGISCCAEYYESMLSIPTIRVYISVSSGSLNPSQGRFCIHIISSEF